MHMPKAKLVTEIPEGFDYKKLPINKGKEGRPFGYSPKVHGGHHSSPAPFLEQSKSASRKIVQALTLLRDIKEKKGRNTEEGIRVCISLLETLTLGDMNN